MVSDVVLTRPHTASTGASAGLTDAWRDLPRRRPLDLNGPTSHPYRPFDRRWIERPIFDAFLAVADTAGDRTAVDDGNRRLSYADLRHAACRLAQALAAETAVPPGIPVGILLPNDASYPVGVLATLAAGHPCVLLDSHYPPARNAAIIADAGIGAVIAGEDAAPAVPAGIPVVPIAPAIDRDGPAVPPLAPPLRQPDAPGFILYTSGSTGRPKGIALAERTIAHRAGQVIDALHLAAEDRLMPLGSPCTVAGLVQMFEALLAGATLFKVDLQRAGLGVVLDTIEQTAATVLLATPALLRRVCQIEDAPQRLRSLRCLYTSGDVLLSIDAARLRDRLSCPLLAAYGATEAPGMAQWFETANNAGTAADVRVASGYPLPDYDYAILDEVGEPVGTGEVGELVVSSRFVALGDWQNGRLVSGRLPRDPRDPRARLLRTGDLARLGDDGLIRVLGRKDRLVKIRGMRVEPYEIECALRRAPAVADATVLVRRGNEDAAATAAADPQLVAFVVLREPAAEGALDSVRAALRQALPAHMQPARLHAVAQLPLLPGHKIDAAALAALDEAQAAAHPMPAAAAPAICRAGEGTAAAAAQLVAAAWEQALDSASLAADLPFDAAGGDSLALLMFVCDLERRCGDGGGGVRLPLLHFSLAMRPSEIARTLDAILGEKRTATVPPSPPSPSPSAQSASLVLLKPGAPTVSAPPPVFLMHGLGGHVAELAELVRHLGCDHPVFGLQLPGLAAEEAALDRIEDMAERFVAPLRAAWPRGPYLLVGYSFGGLVAFDLACRLQALGETTRLLMLDTHPAPRFWPAGAWLRWLTGRAAAQCRQALRGGSARFPASSGQLIGSFLDHLRARRGFGPVSRVPSWLTDQPELRRIRAGIMAAMMRYRPARFPHSVAFIQPEIRQTDAPAAPLAAWRGRVAGLHLMRTPGDHRTMAQEHAAATAELIDAWVRENAES